jgi:hypothetical protein
MMRWLLGPSNSLLLTVDPASLGRFDLEEALEDVGRYYRFGTLSEAVRYRGTAALVFPEARKRHFLHFTPLVRSLDVPVTVFVHPDCVGLTRLPLWEELLLYREHFNALRDEPALEVRAWADAAWAEAQIERLRREHGPLPYNELDPTRFYGRWSDLSDFPPEKLEVGLDLPTAIRPEHEARLQTALAFTRSQVKRPIEWAIGRDAVLDDAAERWLEAQGFRGYLSGLSGALVRGTSRWRLPRWILERTEAPPAAEGNR